jgi:hypothetical protein
MFWYRWSAMESVWIDLWWSAPDDDPVEIMLDLMDSLEDG